jgi:biopolymer transport protein ExbD
MLFPLPVDAAKSCHLKIFVYENGDVAVDGKRYSDRARLKLRLSEYSGRGDCMATVLADRTVRYDALARTLVMLQEFGYMKVGFLTEPRND